jgi:hypothetical protein
LWTTKVETFELTLVSSRKSKNEQTHQLKEVLKLLKITPTTFITKIMTDESRVIRIPIHLPCFLDRMCSFCQRSIQTIFLEPVLNTSGLLNLSILLLLLQRMVSSLSFEQRLNFTDTVISDGSILRDPTNGSYSTSSIFESPFALGFFGSLALVVSCVAYQSGSAISGPLITTIIVILFTFESALILAILMVACQSLYSEDSTSLLIALLLIWTMSLVGSNVSRYFLYSQMGD